MCIIQVAYPAKLLSTDLPYIPMTYCILIKVSQQKKFIFMFKGGSVNFHDI